MAMSEATPEATAGRQTRAQARARRTRVDTGPDTGPGREPGPQRATSAASSHVGAEFADPSAGARGVRAKRASRGRRAVSLAPRPGGAEQQRGVSSSRPSDSAPAISQAPSHQQFPSAPCPGGPSGSNGTSSSASGIPLVGGGRPFARLGEVASTSAGGTGPFDTRPQGSDQDFGQFPGLPSGIPSSSCHLDLPTSSGLGRFPGRLFGASTLDSRSPAGQLGDPSTSLGAAQAQSLVGDFPGQSGGESSLTAVGGRSLRFAGETEVFQSLANESGGDAGMGSGVLDPVTVGLSPSNGGTQVGGLGPVGIASPLGTEGQMSSICDPLGASLPASVREKIVKGEFLDLELLSNRWKFSPPSQGIPLSLDAEGKLVLQEPKRKYQISSILGWTDAFLVFLAVFSSAHPSRVQELLKYMHIVRTAAAQYPGKGWLEYDRQFRMRQQRRPSRSWATIDGELWALLVQAPAWQHPQWGGGQGAGFGSSGVRPSHSFRSQPNSSFQRSNVCYAFNRGKCSFPKCKFAHKCSRCNSPRHGSVKCSGQPQKADVSGPKQ